MTDFLKFFSSGLRCAATMIQVRRRDVARYVSTKTRTLAMILCCSFLCTANVNAQTWTYKNDNKLYEADITMTLNNGTLTISGTGIMPSYSSSGTGIPPWFDVRYSIKKVIIEDGITHISGFSDCKLLASAFIPESVISIADNAFKDCMLLTSVTIPKRVTNIGTGTFSGCVSLTFVDIPQGVTSIGMSAFSSCRSLLSVVIPDGVKSIGTYAFFNCESLISVTIPNSVTSISVDAFNSCTSLKSITIPGSVTSIGRDAFSGCKSLSSVTVSWNTPLAMTYEAFNNKNFILLNVPAGREAAYSAAAVWKDFYIKGVSTTVTEGSCGTDLTWVYDVPTATLTISGTGDMNVRLSTSTAASAFASKIRTLVLPDGLASIYRNAFSGCRSLESVTIPSNVTSIAMYAFSDCSSLTSVTIPANVASIGAGVFSCCTNLAAIEVEAGNTNYISENGVLFDKEKKTLMRYPPQKQENTYTIPGSVTSIDESAFYGCKELTSVTIPGSVTYIANDAFRECTFLSSANIPNSVTYIGEYAFYRCFSLPSVTIPNGITSIQNLTFIDCISLASVTLPESVNYIYNQAFSGCVSLTSINIPNKVTFIGESVFSSCESLPSINLPNSITTIRWNAFQDCKSLTSVIIPKGVTNIQSYTFYGCTSLESVVIPEGVTFIGVGAFSDCSSLTSVAIPCSVTTIDAYAFRSCKSLTSITMPNSVTSLGIDVFDGCSALASASISDRITEIGQRVFGNCTSLTSIIIPDSVITIGAAFDGCTALTEIVSLAADPPQITSNNVFRNVDKSKVTLYVPANSMTGYLAADVWKEFSIKPVVPVTGVSLNKPAATLAVGASETLSATVQPANATIQKVMWHSCDPSVATVDAEGRITVLSPGTTTITATTFDGKTVTCEINVPQHGVGVETVEAPLANIAIYPNPTAGEVTVQLKASGTYNITVADISGKPLLRQTASGDTVQMDFSNYPAGVYLLMVDDGVERKTVKVVKN